MRQQQAGAEVERKRDRRKTHDRLSLLLLVTVVAMLRGMAGLAYYDGGMPF